MSLLQALLFVFAGISLVTSQDQLRESKFTYTVECYLHFIFQCKYFNVFLRSLHVHALIAHDQAQPIKLCRTNCTNCHNVQGRS